MKVDHDKKELHFFICPDKAASNRTDEAMRNDDAASQTTSQGKR